MKLKSILICLFILCGLALQAQELKVLEFRADMSMTDAVRFPMNDLNGNRCGLIRLGMVLPEVTFEGDIISTEYKDGEWWIYMPKGSNWITIKSKTHVPLRYEFEFIQSNVTYLMTVVEITGAGGKPLPTQQYLAFQISPANAVLEVDGELWEVDSDGSAMKFVNFGTYNYRVQAPNYHTEVGKVTVNDPENTQIVPITLKPDFVEVTLKVDADAEIWVNNEKKGTRAWTGNLGKGNYKIECKQAGHETSIIAKEISADMKGQVIDLPKPTPVYGSLNIESTPRFAMVYIDGKKVGETPKVVNEILVGEHEIRLIKDNYTTYKETIIVKKDERTEVKASLNHVTATPSSSISQQTQNRQNKNLQYDRKAFVMANVAYSVAPQISYGLTIGSVGNTGWYLSVASNFLLKHASYECDGSGKINEMYGDGYTDYTYSDQTRNSRLSITAGMAVRIANPVSIYFGGGYGFRELFWILDDGTWVKNTDYSYSSFSFDAGLLLHFGNFGLSVGMQTIGFQYLEAKVGIGFTF